MRLLTKLCHIDAQFLSRIRRTSDAGSIDALAHALTEVGKTPGNLAVALGVATARPSLGLLLLATLAVSECCAAVLKRVVRRARPPLPPKTPHAQVDPYESRSGFPSAHAQNAASVWFLLALSTGRPVLALAATLLALGIGWSRLQLGRHYPLDVLAGFLIGIAIACLASAILRGLPAM